jgi:TonB family protein
VRALSVPLPPVATARPAQPEPPRRVAPNPFATVDFEAFASRKTTTPPKPLHRAIPAGSAELRSRLREPLEVDVRIEIDAAGKVKRAELASKRAESRREFESLALGAARGWTFAPARNGSRRVPSAAVLHYRFGNS